MKQLYFQPNDFLPDEPPKPSIQNPRGKILILLMHNPEMTFNQLWHKEGRSNKFAYHLKALEKKGLVQKTKEGKYSLTVKGKKEVAYMEESSGQRWESPIVAVITLITKDDKYLMLHKAKEPFYGYWGVHGGKLRSANYILEQAKESIKKETGLSCDLELKGLFSSKTFVDKKFAYNHQLFIVKATNPKGTPLKETKKGSNHWVKREDIKRLQILPNIPHLIKIAMGKRFRWIEADRFQEEDHFKEMDIKKDMLL